MTKNRTPTPVYLDPGMHSGLEVKGLTLPHLQIKIWCVRFFATGLVLKLPFLDQPREPTRPLYDDSLWWETPEDFGGHDTDVTGLYKGSQLLNHDGEDEEAKV